MLGVDRQQRDDERHAKDVDQDDEEDRKERGVHLSAERHLAGCPGPRAADRAASPATVGQKDLGR